MKIKHMVHPELTVIARCGARLVKIYKKEMTSDLADKRAAKMLAIHKKKCKLCIS